MACSQRNWLRSPGSNLARALLDFRANLPGLGGIALLALLIACAPEAEREKVKALESGGEPVVQFVDVSQEVGLDFVNVSGTGGPPRYILETQSAGAAFLDYDSDGFLDVFAVNGTRLGEEPEDATNRLFRNEAGSDGSGRVFREVTREAGLEQGGWGMGCAVGDMDNDGDPDLYVTYWGPNLLYRNEGNGRFIEVAEEAGVGDQGWGSSVLFGDIDNDGYLDLYVTNYLEFDPANPPGEGGKCYYKGLEVYCGPRGMTPQPDRIYRNQGNGRFADMGAITGVGERNNPGMGVGFSDFDADGDLDLYVANDSDPNLLYRNDGDWQFTEIATRAGVAYSQEGRSQAGMGVHSGDFDNDGDSDLFVTNFSDDVNTLYQNEGTGLFTDITYEAGLGGLVRPYMGWSTGFFDYDNDGWLDLFVANGHLYPQLDQHSIGLRYVQRNLLYHNQGGLFVEVGGEAGPGWRIEKSSRGTAVGDFDNDGDPDLFVMNINDAPTLLRNDGGNWNNWLGLKLVGEESNRDAIGARVRVLSGDLAQVREVQRGYGFQSQNDPRLLFGLGAGARVDRVEIRWPSGRLQVLEGVPLRRYVVVREGRDEVLAGAMVPRPETSSVIHETPAQELAVADLRPVVGQPGWSAGDYLEAGITFYQRGRYNEARAALEVAIQQDPDLLVAYVNLAVVLCGGLGHYEEGAAFLRQAVQRDSSNVDIFYMLGKVYLSMNRLEPAIQALKKGVALAPLTWEIHDWLGLAYMRADRLEEAAEVFEWASRLAPSATRPHLHLARVYEKLGREEEARRERWFFEQLVAEKNQEERR